MDLLSSISLLLMSQAREVRNNLDPCQLEALNNEFVVIFIVLTKLGSYCSICKELSWMASVRVVERLIVYFVGHHSRPLKATQSWFSLATESESES